MNKAPKPKSDLQDFLSMFEQQKMDPIMLEELKDEEDDSVVIHDFLTFEKDSVLKTEAYYVTKQSQIKGTLYIKPGLLYFEPIDSDENEIVRIVVLTMVQDRQYLHAFRAQFDYQDIDSLEVIKLINEKALQTDNNYIKKAYKYEYLVQINLTTVNGLTLVKESED